MIGKLLVAAVTITLTGCGTIPVQSITGAGVSPQGTAFFIETRNGGMSEALLVCREFLESPPACMRYPIEQPTGAQLSHH